MLSSLSVNVAVILSLVSSRSLPETIFLAARARINDGVLVDPKLHSVVSC